MSLHEILSSFPYVILIITVVLDTGSRSFKRTGNVDFSLLLLMSVGAIFAIATFISGYWAYEGVGEVKKEVEEAIKFHHSVGRLILFVFPFTFGILCAKTMNPGRWLSFLYYVSLFITLGLVLYVSLLGKNLL